MNKGYSYIKQDERPTVIHGDGLGIEGAGGGINALEKMMQEQAEKNKTFYHDMSDKSDCLFDSLSEESKRQVMCLSCNCPKCSFR